MEWISVKDRLPDVNKLGDGNICKVKVKYKASFNLPEYGEVLFGCSGFPNEPKSFFSSRPIEGWMPLPEPPKK